MLLIIIALQIIGIYFMKQLETNLKTNFQDSIRQRIELVHYSIREEMLKEPDDTTPPLEVRLGDILQEFSTEDINKINVVNNRYRILATSDANSQAFIGQRANEEIIRKSISAETIENIISLDRDSGNRVWVLASPITNTVGGEVIGAVYVESNIEKVYEQLNEINRIFAVGIAMSLVITIILGILVARTITRPISDMRKQAQAMSKGNYSRKVRVYGTDEIGQLAIAFNHLTNRLQEAQSTTEAERRKLASVLSNMTDGVIATDRKGKIILINEPALELLHDSRETTLNRPITSVLRLDQEYSFEDLIHMKDAINLDFTTNGAPYVLRANFSVMQKETGFVNGLITVLHDITEQEKIDMERREFVANVSHELRTPLTTMRSYLEALADGAWRDENIAPTFLNVTQTETERMIRLVNDLLQLSKMDSQEYELNCEFVEFNKFFTRIIDRFEMSKSQKVEFIRLLPGKCYYVDIDTDKLTQVFYDLTSKLYSQASQQGAAQGTTADNAGAQDNVVHDADYKVEDDNK